MILAIVCVLIFFALSVLSIFIEQLPEAWDEKVGSPQDAYNGIYFDARFWNEKYRISGNLKPLENSDFNNMQEQFGNAHAYQKNMDEYYSAKKKIRHTENSVTSVMCAWGIASVSVAMLRLFPDLFLVRWLNFAVPAAILGAIGFIVMPKIIEGKSFWRKLEPGSSLSLEALSECCFDERKYDSIYKDFCIDKEKYPPLFFFATEIRGIWFSEATKELVLYKKLMAALDIFSLIYFIVFMIVTII
jgi:hypothetical protein